MTNQLARFREIAALDHGLCVVSMQRPDGSIAVSVVNAGVMQHPRTGTDAVAFVARGLRKLDHLRTGTPVTVVARAGWQWSAAEGTAEIFGPDDPQSDMDSEALRLLLRSVFTAAGGTHDDWDPYDQTLADERSAAVFITPVRTYPTV